jgi:hypothetical protein
MLTARVRSVSAVFVLAPLALLADPTSARADDTAACNAAYEQADLLAHAPGDKLLDAREKARACASPACKAWMIKECSTMVTDLEARIPTVVFEAKDRQGNDLTEVSVALDGKVVTPRLDGHAMEMDPGGRTFVFTTADGHSAEVHALVKEGEKSQLVQAVFADIGAPAPAAATADTAAQDARAKTQRTAAVIVSGVGVASIIVGSVFGLTAISKNHDSNSNGHCDATGCDPTGTSLRNTALGDATASTVTFIVGGALAAAGITLFLTAPKSKAPATGLEVQPAVGPQFAGLTLGQRW